MRSSIRSIRGLEVPHLCVGSGAILLFSVLLLAPLLIGIVSLAITEPAGLMTRDLVGVFSTARLTIAFDITVRALIVVSVAAPIGIFVAEWLGSSKNRFVLLAVPLLMIVPFFSSDTIKSYAWAEILLQFKSYLPFVPSPYDNFSPYLPLVLKALPIFVLIVAPAYTTVVERQRKILLELGATPGLLLRSVTLPALAPYAVGAYVLAFAFIVPSAAELQFLGGGLPNTITSLIHSILRVSVLQTEVFSLAIVVAAAAATAILTFSLLTRDGSMQRSVFKALGAFRVFFSCGWCQSAARYLKCARLLGAATAWAMIMLMWLPLVETLVLAVTNCSGQVGACFAALRGDSSFWTLRLQGDLHTSLVLGVCAIAGGWIISITGVWQSVFGQFRVLWIALVLLMLLVPGDVVALGLAQAAVGVGVTEGSLALAALSHLILIFPYCFLIGMFAGLALPRQAVAALLELGMGPITIMRRAIIFSEVSSACASAAFFGGLISLNDYTRLSYVGGANEGITSYLASQLNAGSITGNPTSYIISAVLVAIGVIVTAFVAVRAPIVSPQTDEAPKP